MRLKTAIREASKPVIFISGVLYTLTALALLFAPHWFYENIADFDPYNRHFMGDIGAFSLPIGIGLLIAARNPARHRDIILLAIAASVIHALNHAYDAINGAESFGYWIQDTVPLILFVVILAAAHWAFNPAPNHA
jgi:peptidoglycan/LPS O-acetylase OafA/YrhL